MKEKAKEKAKVKSKSAGAKAKSSPKDREKSKKPKARNKSPRKGSAFEREMCVKLSLWWTGGARDDAFYRTPGSGARATSRAKKSKETSNQHGDVSATDQIGEPLLKLFRFELKRGYSKSTVQDMLDGRKSDYRDWTAHARKCATASGSLSWMLIHRRDKRKAVCVLPGLIYDVLMAQSPPLPLIAWEVPSGCNVPDTTVCVLLDDLLASVKPHMVHRTLGDLLSNKP